jgi:energy-coupling factor transport system ATP-binding protein
MWQVAEVVNRITEQGRTAVVVTHDPEFILRCCNFVIHMEHGEIQERYSLCEPEGRERLLRFFLNEMG